MEGKEKNINIVKYPGLNPGRESASIATEASDFKI
jgi:hypothetical protein